MSGGKPKVWTQMSNLKKRISDLYKGNVSDVTSRIQILKNDKVVKQKTIGNNQFKMIEIIVRL